MSIPMAIVDFIPVGLFLAAAVILQRDLYNKMSKGAFALFSAGTITVFVAGCFKATWKLIYALGICDFEVLNKTFFPMQTTGFILAALGMIALLCHKQGKNTAYAVAAAPAVFKGTMIFVVLMVLGVVCLDGALMVIAARRKKPAALVLYVISFVFIMGMGYLSSKDFTNPMMNWIGEGVNIVGQGTFLMGTWVLHKNGLAEADALRK